MDSINILCYSRRHSKSSASCSCSNAAVAKPPSAASPELVNESLNSSMHDGEQDLTCAYTLKMNARDTGRITITEQEQIATACSTLISSCASTSSSTDESRRSHQIPKKNPNCDACPCCKDVCCTNYEEECLKCSSKMAHFRRLSKRRRQQQLLKEQQRQQHILFPFFPNLQFTSGNLKIHDRLDRSINDHNHNQNNTDAKEYFTMTKCQMRRYNNKHNGIYIQCDDKMIYDVTSYIDHHPGGIKSILRRSGGATDCKRDLNFHSSNAKKLWKKFHVGYLVECPGNTGCDDYTYLDVSMGGNQTMDILDQNEQCIIS